MPRISEEARQAGRQRLIDATTSVAARDGADGLTTRAITAEAGVSAGMFYGHFESKEALLGAVVDDKVDALTMVVDAEMQMGVPVEDVLRRLLTQLFTHDGIEVLALFRAASTTPGGLDAQRRINARIVDAFTPILSAGIAAGLVDPDVDAHAVVEFIDIALDGLARRRAHDTFATSDERLTTTVLGAIERFLLTPSGILS